MKTFVITEITGKMTVHDRAGNIVRMKERLTSSILFTYSGQISFFDGNETFFSDKKHPIFLPEGSSYVNTCLEDAHSVMFSFRTLDGKSMPMRYLSVPDENYFYRCEKEYDGFGAKNGITSEFARYSMLYSMMKTLTSDENEKMTGGNFVDSAISEMNAHFDDSDFSVRSLSEKLNISEVYLRKLFIKETGMPPYSYLRKIRMDKAFLFLSENRTVSEVARDVGYSDVYQFSHAYKKFYGKTPSSHKK